MPLTNTIHQTFNKISKGVKPKHQKLVAFGLSAYSLTPYQSAASNARRVVTKHSTACRKSERLLANKQIGDELNEVLIDQVNITPSSIINVDHTDSDLLTSLVGAVQTRKGRAVPVFAQSTYSDRIPSFGSRHSTKRTDQLRQDRQAERSALSFSAHITSTIEQFVTRLGFAPRFAFDRGFGGMKVISYLQSIGATFYVRLKGGRTVDDGYGVTAVSKLKEKDEVIELDGILLRVIRSSKNRRCKEPWYILTNDFRSSRNKILRIYYHRFEIEELFKDTKHLLELKRARFNRPNSLKVILLLVFIGIAILFAMSRKKAVRALHKLRGSPVHPKKALSWVRETWELIYLLGWR